LNIFQKLYSIINPQERKKLLIFIVVLLAFVVAETTTIVLIVPLLDSLGSYQEGINDGFLNKIFVFFNLPTRGIEVVYFLILIFFIASLIKSCLHIIVLKKTASIPYDIFYNKSHSIITNYYSMKWSDYTKVNSNEVIKKTTKSNEMAAYAYVIALQFVTSVFVVTFLSSMLLFYNFIVTSTLVIILGTIVFILFRVMKNIQKEAGINRELRLSGVFKTASEAILSMKDQRVIGTEEYFKNRFLHEAKGLSQALKDVTFYPPLQLIFIEFFGIIALLSVITFVIFSDLSMAAILPSLIFYAFAFRRIIPSMGLISSLSMTLKNLEASVDIIYSEMIINKNNLEINTNEDNNIFNKSEFDDSWKSIQFKNIFYSYDGNIDALSNINIEFNRNKKIGIVGESGSGKSTLIDIFSGLSSPSSGQLFFNEIEVDDLSILQGHIGYVPQMLNILDDSLLNNITFGREFNNKKLDKAIQISYLDEFINELENGLNEVLGERGVRLSGGQRQRIAIARALYDDPNIIVFDEATSALDNISEKYINKMIEELSRDKTIIAIAHRLTTVHDFDILHVIEKGQIVASGTHKNLLDTCELYRLMNNA
jgi:ATP-binding cassette subfamily B protein